MVRKLLFMLVFLFAITSVIALETEVNVKTYPEHNLTVIVVDAIENKDIKTFELNSDLNGEVSFKVSSEVPKLTFSMTLRKEGKIVIFEKFENYTAGNRIDIILTKTKFRERAKTASSNATTNKTVNATLNATNVTTNATEIAKVNETTNETTLTTIQTTNETIEKITKEGVTGASVSKITEFISKKIYLIIGVVIVAAIMVFFILKVKISKKEEYPQNIKVRKYSEIKDEIKVHREKEKKAFSQDDKKILELEEKLNQTQEEIEKIKEKRTKIKEAEKKFEEARRELEKLRSSGY